MVKTCVKSSFIRAIGANKRLGTITVTMDKGTVYRYFGVTQKTISGLIACDSKGWYYNEYVKGRYHSKRVK